MEEKNGTDRGEESTQGEKWQKLKMLIGVISKGEAAQGREGSRAAHRRTRLCEESLCLRDKVERRKREGRRVGAITIQIVENNKIPHR